MTAGGRAGVGRDADGAAAGRLTDALRAQAALGARPSPTGSSRTTPGPGTPAGGIRPGGSSGSQPGHAKAARGLPGGGRPAGGAGGPHGPDRTGRPVNPQPDGGAGQQSGPASPAVGPAPGGSTAARVGPAARADGGHVTPAVRLRWVLLAALLAGALLGCMLAVLSVLDTGLFPALG